MWTEINETKLAVKGNEFIRMHNIFSYTGHLEAST